MVLRPDEPLLYYYQRLSTSIDQRHGEGCRIRNLDEDVPTSLGCRSSSRGDCIPAIKEELHERWLADAPKVREPFA